MLMYEKLSHIATGTGKNCVLSMESVATGTGKTMC